MKTKDGIMDGKERPRDNGIKAKEQGGIRIRDSGIKEKGLDGIRIKEMTRVRDPKGKGFKDNATIAEDGVTRHANARANQEEREFTKWSRGRKANQRTIKVKRDSRPLTSRGQTAGAYAKFMRKKAGKESG